MKYQKLAFFIENPHHLDFYKNIFSYLNKAQFYIILNDKDKNREIFKEPISLIEKFNLNYFFLSEAEDFYFDYIVSTLESKILYFNLLKKKIFFSRSNIFALKILNKLNLNLHTIEKSLSKSLIFFPTGMDIKKIYLNQFKKKNSDIYFCHSEIDSKIVKNETKRETFIVGNPRYDKSLKTNENHIKENILFLPSVGSFNKTRPNVQIENFLKNFKNQFSKYNFYLKPHPKYSLNKEIMSMVYNYNIKILNQYVDLGSFYNLANFVICNNTSPFFDSVFNEKPAIILNEMKGEFHPVVSKIYNKYKNYYFVGEENTHLVFKGDKFSENFWQEQKKIRKKFKDDLFKNSPDNGSKICGKFLNKIISNN